MSVDDRVSDGHIVTHERFQSELAYRTLESGGGGGTFDNMEPRVKRLEDDMKEVKDGLLNVRERLARIVGQLADMPTKDWMNTRMLAYFGVTIAAIGAMIKFL